jgi:riboflavin synthase
MFTGIITAIGSLVAPLSETGVLQVRVPASFTQGVSLGDSIAVNGVCLTVTAFESESLRFDLSSETRARTTFNQTHAQQRVNLEKALKFGATLDGHLVSGHVDGVGHVTHIDPHSQGTRMVIAVPEALRRFLAVKGSMTVDGVSLTVNEVFADGFSVTLIPHTLEWTTLKEFDVGQRVNLEVDLIARYVERLLAERQLR